MKKFISCVFAILLIISNSTPANAASAKLRISNYGTVTYPTEVKLVATGCQNVVVSYTATNLDPTLGYIAFAISNANGDQVGSFWLNKGTLAVSAGPQFPVAKRLGTVGVKICRKAWSSATDDNVGVRKGTYEVWFTAMGPGLDSSSEVFGTIKFK